MLDAANKAAGVVSDFVWPILNGDLHRSASEYDLGARGEQELPKKAFDAAGGVMMGSSFAQAPKAALRAGMASGGDLDMSQAAKLQRARDLGFDTETTVYHGTNRVNGDISEFKINDDGAAWFSKDPSVAGDFTNGYRAPDVPSDGAIYPSFLNKKNYATVDWPEYLYALKEERGQPRGTTYSGSRGVSDQKQMLDEYRSQGYDGVEILRAGEKPGYMQDTAWAVFNPSTIRNVNAAFDPAKAGSANIMSANPFNGAVVPMYVGDQE